MKRKDNVELICSIGEISSLFKKGEDIPRFLNRTVSILSEHMQAEVCSIYLYDEGQSFLTMAATEGLAPTSVGKVKMRLGEGLTGKAVKEYRTIREAFGSKNPSFMPFPETEEDRYEAFLAVPIHKGLQRIGAIVLQHSKPGYFSEHDAKALKAIAAQLASLLENAQLLLQVTGRLGNTAVQENKDLALPKLIKGQKISEGIAVAKSILVDWDNWTAAAEEESCGEGNSLENFDLALEQTGKEIEELQLMLEKQYADVASLIFSSHLLMLQDTGFSGRMREIIVNGSDARDAVIGVVTEYEAIFSQSENERIREKSLDIKDLGHRILRNLGGNCQPAAEYSDKIVIAKELLPSELLKIAAQDAAGLILYGSGTTAHVAILAKSLDIPVMLCDNEQLFKLKDDTRIIIDGHRENIFIDPEDSVTERYLETKNALASSAEQQAAPECRTACGEKVTLLANINILNDLHTAHHFKAEGVGLYRSEFPFLIRNDFPSEEEQVRVYKHLFDSMGDKEVTLRTLDIGGDKILSYLPGSGERNPFLGLRAIRFSLKNKDIFKIQLRAMLRAGANSKARIMFPLVSSVDDFSEAREILRECAAELKEEDTAHIEDPSVGAMVELPSLIEVINEISKEADFLCIGTNDLIQYLLGVDRTNSEISHLYIAHHPSVFRVLNRIITSARKNDCDISICGEIAADPQMLPFLVGSGIRKISLNPRNIPKVQNILSSRKIAELETYTKKLLGMGSMKEIRDFLGLAAE